MLVSTTPALMLGETTVLTVRVKALLTVGATMVPLSGDTSQVITPVAPGVGAERIAGDPLPGDEARA